MLLLAGGGTFDAAPRKAQVLGVQFTPPPVRAPLRLDESTGYVLRGLERSAAACLGAFRTRKTGRCTHGPDAAPAGVDISVSRRPVQSSRAAGDAGSSGGPSTFRSGGTGVVCDGDGQTGKRVHAIYARPPGTNRYGQYLDSFRQWAGDVDRVFNDSAAETAGVRHVRFVTDAGCNLVVDNVPVTNAAAADFDALIAELEAGGYNRTDRIYLVWMDATEYCGIGTMWPDERPDPNVNYNNRGPAFSRVDAGCWGQASPVEAHELVHNMGGVQNTAPHSTFHQGTGGHCSDRYDRMCYDDDGPGPVSMSFACNVPSRERLLDCNHDDYFYAGTPPPGNWLATHWNVADSSFLLTADPSLPAVSGAFTPLTPARVFDTRDPGGSKIAAGQTKDVQITGQGGVPSSGVGAVALNVTVTGPTAGGYLTVFPNGVLRPHTSSLNFVAGQTVPNMVVVRVGTGGKINVFNSAGSSHVIVDVAGWWADSSGGVAGRYRPLTPARILDTRSGAGAIVGGTSRTVQVANAGGVPITGVAGVVLNVTAVSPTAAGYLTIYPADASQPLASNLNFTAGQVVPNRVFVKLSAAGAIKIFNAAGLVDVVVDVAGWFSDSTGSASPPGELTALTPARVLDTRESSALGPGQSRNVSVAGVGGVPANAAAVVLNVTATGPSEGGYLTVWPKGVSMPLASDVNFLPGQTVPNLVVVKVGDGGQVGLFNSGGATHVIFDVVAWLS